MVSTIGGAYRLKRLNGESLGGCIPSQKDPSCHHKMEKSNSNNSQTGSFDETLESLPSRLRLADVEGHIRFIHRSLGRV